MKLAKILLASIAAASIAFPAAAEKLVLLHTNDTHSQIDPTTDDNLGGVARRKVVIDSVKAVHGNNMLLVDAGDVVQGTLFFNIYKGELEEKLMNLLGYDIRILGNHEFDNGMEDLAKNLMISDAELLASNYQTIGTPLEGLFMPYTIKLIDGKRVAFMPINLEPEGMISPRNTKGMGYVDALETANHLAWYLKNIEQADLVVAVTHIGYEVPGTPDDVTLVKQSKDIDVLIGGHSHTKIDPNDPQSPAFLVNNADGKPVLVAQTGKSGRYVGEITIDLDNPDHTPDYKLIKIDSRLDSRVDPAVEQTIKPYRAEVNRLNSQKVAKTAAYLDKESDALLNFAADFVAYRGRQMNKDLDFAIINKGGIRNSLPKGDITVGQIITLMPFFNRIQTVEIKGSDLLDAFDTMANVDGNGVSEEIVATYDPDTKKAVSVKLNGTELDPEKKYVIATIDYLTQGGDYMTGLTHNKLLSESQNYLFEDLLDYLQNGAGKGKTINPSSKKRMSPVK